MNNVTAYIGRDFGRGEWSSKDVVMATLDAMQDHGIEGATFTEAVGFWNGEAENSIRVEMLGVDVEAARAMLCDVCESLMQWAIAYTIDGQGHYMVEQDPTAARAAYSA